MTFEWTPMDDDAPMNRPVLVYVDGTAGLGVYRAIRADWRKSLVAAPEVRWRPVGYTCLDEFPPGVELTHWAELPDGP